jgi:hypothetical protein
MNYSFGMIGFSTNSEGFTGWKNKPDPAAVASGFL